MEDWYLIYCKRGQLNRAKRHLEQQQVICFCPLHTIEKYSRGKRILSQSPLFPSYLFIKFDPENIHTTTISATRGVSHFIHFGIYPAKVPLTLIYTLMNQSMPHTIDHLLPKRGDKVRITEGIFSGLNAIYAEPNDEKRSILLLDLINKPVRYCIENSQFEKIKLT